MLIAATSRGDLHESRRLIEEEDVDVNEADAMGQTPLHVSVATAVCAVHEKRA